MLYCHIAPKYHLKKKIHSSSCLCLPHNRKWLDLQRSAKKMRTYICMNKLLFSYRNPVNTEGAVRLMWMVSHYSLLTFSSGENRTVLHANTKHTTTWMFHGKSLSFCILIWHGSSKDQLVVWAFVSLVARPEPWGLGQHLGCFWGWGL